MALPWCRAARRRPSVSARRRVNPLWLECLEDRLAPATAVTLGPLQFFGDFTGGPDYSANGVVQLGLAPTQGENFRPLLQINGSVSFSTGQAQPTFAVTGAIASIAQPTPAAVALWQGDTTVDVNQLVGAGVGLTGGLSVFFDESQGANFTASFVTDTLALSNPQGGSTADSQVLLQGQLSFSFLSGFLAPVQDGHYVTMDQSGIHLPANYSATVAANGPGNRFRLFGMAADPSPGLAIAFDANLQAFAVYGPLGLYSGDGGIAAATGYSLGSHSQPGLVLQAGTVQSLNLQTPDKLDLFQLPFQLDNPVMHFDLLQQRWEIWGDARLDEIGTFLVGSLGDADDPGIVLSGSTGELESVRLVINRNFTLGPLVFEPKNLTLTYASDGVYTIAGTLGCPILFDASATLGTPEHPGIEIHDGQVQVHQLTIRFDGVFLGSFTISDLFVSYSDEEGEVEVEFGGKLWLPMADAGLGLQIGFRDGDLDSVAVAEHGVQIPIGDTDAFITAIDAEVKNLSQPADLYLAGAVTITWGPKLELGEKAEVSLFKASGNFSVDRHHLHVGGSIVIGAWTNPINGETEALIAKGTGWLDLNWSENDYRAGLEVEWLDGTFRVKAEMDIRLGLGEQEIAFRGEASVNVPDFVPFIGGDEIGGVDFAFLYRPGQPLSHSYAAAWTEVDLLIDTVAVGVKVDFTGDVDVIGSDDIDSIEHDTRQKAPTVFEYASNFQVPTGATRLVLGVTWPTSGGTQKLSLTLPDGRTLSEDQFSTVHGISILTNQSTRTSRYVQVVGADPYTPIAAGVYRLTLISSGVGKYSTQPKFSSNVFYTPPTALLPVLPASAATAVPVEIRATAISALVPLATVTLYLDFDDQGYDGIPVAGAQNLPLANASYDPQTRQYKVPATWNLSGLLPVPHYLYAVVHDGVNPPVRSAYSGPTTPMPPLSGNVSDVAPNHGNAALNGITVYLDTNHNNRYDPGVDPSTITAVVGFYSFYDLTPGQTYTVGVVVPHGFQLDPASTNPVTFQYTGTPATINFGLNKLPSISGSVFADLNQNGQRDADEPGLTGWTVTLRSNGTDVATAYTGSDGGYTFYALAPGSYKVVVLLEDNFFQTGPTPIPPGSFAAVIAPTHDDPYPQVVNQDFGVLPFSTISGTVRGHQLDNGTLRPLLLPLEGWTIELLQNGQVVRTTTTAADGSYEFIGLRPGDYTVQQVVPAGWRQVAPFHSHLQFADPIFVGNNEPNTPAVPAHAIAVADFDGDGHLDFATPWLVGEMRGVNVFFGRGDGTFPDVVSVLVPAPSPEEANYQLLVADMQGTGRPDLIVADSNGDLWRLINQGSRRFSVLQRYPNIPRIPSYKLGQGANLLRDDARRGHLIAADLDNDGRDDIAASYFSHPSGPLGYYHLYIIYAGNKPPLDVPYASVTPLSAGGGLAAGYINSDGFLDLLIAGGGKLSGGPTDIPTTSVAYNWGFTGPSGAGMFRAPFTSILATDLQDLGIGGGAAVADIDGDGLPDGVTGSSGVVGPAWTLGLAYVKGNTGKNTLLAHAIYNQNTGLANYKVFLHDLDGDLKPDLILLPASPTAPFTVWVNDGSGRFGSSGVPFSISSGQSTDLAFGDVNGDGLLDMLVADSQLRGVHIFVNTSSINQAIPLTVAPYQHGLVDFTNAQMGQINGRVFADRNGDGKEVAGEPGQAGVTVYLDLNRNGQLNAGEPSAVTGPHGSYAFSDLPAGSYQVRVLVPAGQRVTTHAGGFQEVILGPGSGSVHTVNFGTRASLELVLEMPRGGGDWRVTRHGQHLEVRDRHGTLIARERLGDLVSLTIRGSSHNDRLTLDLETGGYFRLPGGIRFLGRGGEDRLVLISGSEDDLLQVRDRNAAMERGPEVRWSGVERLDVHGGHGNDTLSVRGRPGAWLRLLGGHGHDTYLLATWQTAMHLIDVAGKDKLDFSQASHAVHLRMVVAPGQRQEIGGGNRLAVTGRLELLVGSPFDDVIHLGSGEMAVLGGAGNDLLRAGGGRSLLIGGPGRDRLIGARGGSVLVGGSTVHDAHDQALLAILAEWASARPLAQRIAHLHVGGSDSLNGDYLLDAAAVLPDALPDFLSGGLEDWSA